MDKQAYLCKNCGNINYLENKDFKIIYNNYLCKCGKPIIVEDSYPNLQAVDLIFSVKEIYINCKKQDKENKKNFIYLLKSQNLNLDNDKINSIIKLYENNKANYPDNKRESYVSSFDSLDKILLEEGYIVNQIDIIASALPLTMRNKMRKPFIVMASSAIEMLFNDYFNDFIDHMLDENGAKIIKKQFNKDSISKCITIMNGLLNGKFFYKANQICFDFISKWERLREYRNAIVHNNNLFITGVIIHEMYNFLNESIKVFLQLKSELYKNEIL